MIAQSNWGIWVRPLAPESRLTAQGIRGNRRKLGLPFAARRRIV